MNQPIILCDKIDRANISSIKSIIDGVIIFYPGTGFSLLDDINTSILSQDGKQAPAGLIVDKKLTVSGNVDYLTHIDLTSQPQIFRLRSSDGQIFILGSKDNPVKCSTVSREVSKTKYTFIQSSKDFIL